MMYFVGATSFVFGFALAVAIICRVSLRHRAKRVLQEANVIPLYRARVPRSQKEDENGNLIV